MSKSIFQLVDELPTCGLTISMLKALDFVAPGEWQNTVGFVNTIKKVTGEDDEDLIQQIGANERFIYSTTNPKATKQPCGYIKPLMLQIKRLVQQL